MKAITLSLRSLWDMGQTYGSSFWGRVAALAAHATMAGWGKLSRPWAGLREVGTRCASHDAARLVTYALTIVCLAGDLGPLPRPALRLVAGASATLLAWLFLTPLIADLGRLPRRRVAASAGILVVATGLGVLLSRGLGGGAAVILLLAGIHLVLTWNGQPSRVAPLLLATVLWTGLQGLLSYSVDAWYAFGALTRALAAAAGVLFQRSFTIGPTAAGTGMLLFFLLLGTSLHLMARDRSWRRLAAYSGLLWVVQMTYLGLVGWLETGVIRNGWVYVSLNLDTSPYVLFMFLSVIAAAIWSGLPLADAPLHAPGARRWVALGLIATASLIVMAPPQETRSGGTVAFLIQKDSVPGSLWTSPEHGLYGKLGGGMYGELPRYLRRTGLSTKFINSPVTPESLAGVSTIAAIMPFERWEPMELEAVWRHVRQGASLLVVGDHTGGDSFRRNINDLLAPTPIQLNSDAAWPKLGMWWGIMNVRPHAISAVQPCIREAAGSGLSVGGSLAIRWPAEPLLVGRYGWADVADPLNQQGGGLGDNHRDWQERLGDVVLCSASRLGLGKVIVFGDASPFQNSALPDSYGFVRDVFYWLQCRSAWSVLRGNLVLGLIVLGLGLWLARGARPTVAWLVVLALLLGLISAAAFAARAPLTPPPARTDHPEAAIDLSHLNLVSEGGSAGNAYWGLIHNLMREHYLPMVYSRLDAGALSQSPVLVMPTPLATIRPTEIALYDRWLRAGGVMLLSVGYEQREAALPLLQHVGISVLGAPLGRTTSSWRGHTVQFYEAWPLEVNNPSARVVLADENAPLMVDVPVGRGRTVVVGDSFFWLNKNLEGQDKWYEGNIALLDYWLEQAVPKEMRQ